jgi:hypothetical protein
METQHPNSSNHQTVSQINTPSEVESFYEPEELDLVGAARALYQKYLQIHEHRAKEPIGVVLNPISYRGKLLFRHAPVLLPEERFIPLHEMRNGNRY